jgi:hypothetical protein
LIGVGDSGLTYEVDIQLIVDITCRIDAVGSRLVLAIAIDEFELKRFPA